MLPNSPNVILAAERAAELSERAGAGGAHHGAPGGPGRAAGVRPEPRTAEHNARAVADAAAGLVLGGVAESARQDPQGRFGVGDAVGYRGDELVSWGDPAQTLRDTLAAVAEGAELVTCIVG